MSRVAEALRKSRGGIEHIGAADERAWLEPVTTPDDPWNLTAAAQPEPEPLAPALLEVAAPAAREGRRELAAPASVASPDELSRLVLRIFQPASGTQGVRSVVFSPVAEGTDAASLCASAAQALAARTSEPVCIVGGNLRTPGLDAAFGLAAVRGLSDALVDMDPTTDVGSLAARIDHNLWLLPAGSRCGAALPNFTAEQLRIRLRQLLATFEYVLIDASPASTHTDVSVLGPIVDGVVLIVEANATRREAARRVAAQLHAANVRMLGAVLTNRTFPIPDAIYRRL